MPENEMLRHHKSIELDIKSLGSKLEMKTYLGSKILDEPDNMYMA